MDEFLKNLPMLVDEIKALSDTIITNIVLIGQVPAPTFKEKRRSNLFQERLAEFGVDEVTTDGYRNPIGIIRGTSPEKPPIFVGAHLDTFFERDIVHNIPTGKIPSPDREYWIIPSEWVSCCHCRSYSNDWDCVLNRMLSWPVTSSLSANAICAGCGIY